MAESLPAILAQGLTKSFTSRRRDGHTRAVDGVDLSVAPGEIFCLVGPDGAGKTTLIRLLSGLLAPDVGWAKVCGRDVQRQKQDVHRRIGYMAQQFSLYGDLTAYENLCFFAGVYGMGAKARRERIPRLLDSARLSPFRSRPAAQLSGGMRKKLALACTLAHEPAVALLDEPTTGVDPVSRREFWDTLTGLRLERNLTILVSTPSMDEAERCHRVGLMYEGRLIACGTPAEIKRLVPGALLELRPAQWRIARDVLRVMDGVLEVQTYGEKLHVFVDDAGLRAPQLAQALEAQGIACPLPRPISPRLEEAFVSLIRRRRREALYG